MGGLFLLRRRDTLIPPYISILFRLTKCLCVLGFFAGDWAFDGFVDEEGRNDRETC